jgi:nucleoid-associated protein YgaU
LAEVADAPALARRSYDAGVTLERAAQELSTAGRLNDALARAVEAGARFRAAEIEANAEVAATTAWERLGLADAPTAPARRSLAETPQPPIAPAAAIEEMIRDVIAQYVSGLESRNLAALKRVWPSLGGSQERAIQTEFENARTVQTKFTDPRITVNGDITTVTGFRMYSLVTQDGQRLSSVTRTTMTLRRNGDAWVIERVVHQQ